MHILFDGRVIQDHFPGIGRYAYNLLRTLPEILDPAVDQVVVLHDPAAANTRYDLSALQHLLFRWQTYPVPIFGAANALGAPKAAGVTAAHFTYYVRPILGWRLPSATTIYDAISFTHPQWVPSARSRLLIKLFHMLSVRASRVVLTISESAADDLARIFPGARDKLVVTPLAADAAFQVGARASAARIRNKYDLPPEFSLYLASNKPHKNIPRLIEAWKRVIDSQADPASPSASRPVLVIAGHQDLRYPQAQVRAAELGIVDAVKFIGDVSAADMPGLYAACALFVYPSLYEGFGLTPLEAMACGAPVVCSNSSSLPEVIGTAGLLFDPEDPGAIAEACIKVLGDTALRREMSANSLAQAAKFSWRATAERTVQAYRSL